MSADAVHIRRCPPQLRREAFEHALGDLEPELRGEQLAQLGEAGNGASAGEGLLWLAESVDQRPLAVLLARMLPGHAALVWPARPWDAALPQRVDHNAVLERLTRAATVELQQAGARLAQALLPREAVADATILHAAGWETLTDLGYLAALAEIFPTSEPPLDASFTSLSRVDEKRLSRVIEETYRETQDCPRMNELRTLDDVLEGYRGVGEFSPDHWLLLTDEVRDAGCLLLAPHPGGSLELVYMGLVPEARGRGWGRQIVQCAQWRARQLACRQLVLAVDLCNQPALAMYEACGCFLWDTRRVLVKALG